MQKKIIGWAFAPLLLASPASHATEITACVVDGNIQDNPAYYHLPTISTKLICDLKMGDKYRPTLQILYANGWRLIQAVDPTLMNQGANRRVSPVFYLEREQRPKNQK